MTDQLGFSFDEPPKMASSAQVEALGTDEASTSATLRSLARFVAGPPRRRLLVCRTRGEGRELLKALTRNGVSWIGVEATTPGPLALELASPDLTESGLRSIDDFSQTEHIERALDRVLLHPSLAEYAKLAEAVGFRTAVQDAVVALRLAGVEAQDVRRARFAAVSKRHLLAEVLDRYVQALEREGEIDAAGILTHALHAFGVRTPRVDRPEDVALLPGLPTTGLTGRWVHALRDWGATVLEQDAVLGLEPPRSELQGPTGAPAPGSFLHVPEEGLGSRPSLLEMDAFRAGTVADELREVLRRVAAEGRAWDEVEIATPDAHRYGSALHALARTLEIPVTFGVGLPIERTRPGQVVGAFFRWVDSGFTSAVLRTLLEAEDLRPDTGYEDLAGMDLARALRSLRIGWGRQRTLDRLQSRRRGLERPGGQAHPSQVDAARSTAEALRELDALESILEPLVAAVPEGVPDPSVSTKSAPVAPSGYAHALRVLLSFVPARDSVDATALEALGRTLARLEETARRTTEPRAAAAIVQAALKLRVPAPREDGRAPWNAAPGALYLTDLDHAGRSGRVRVFVVGMDSSRFPTAGLQDPLLLDRERRSLSPDLATSAERRAEEQHRFASVLARLRGHVTVSYAVWEPSEARALTPAPAVLQVWRAARADATQTFRDLEVALGDPVSVVPTGTPLDAQDVWMDVLARPAAGLDAAATVMRAYPWLERGSRAVQAPQQPEPNAWLGVIQPRPELDPRNREDRPISASRLETLGTCPRRYLYASVLRLRAPEEPEYDADRWLDPLSRGSLLHAVYEGTLQTAREREVEFPDPEFETIALSHLERELRRVRDLVPTPSRFVRDREILALREDVRSFVHLVRAEGAPWIHLELRFGAGSRGGARLPLRGGHHIWLRGAVDRVDEPGDGLVLIDYKTGSSWSADKKAGRFEGGRRLQSALYVKAIESVLQRRADQFVYQYPTRRAHNAVLEYSAEELEDGLGLVSIMLEGAASGGFVPTDEARDCGFCDFAPVCRVRDAAYETHSPHAAWTQRHFEAAEEDPSALPGVLKPLRDIREEAVPPEDLADLLARQLAQGKKDG